MTDKTRQLHETKLLQYSSMLLGGIGLGWIMGLSSSPVVSSVLTSLLAVVAAIASALSGLKTSDDHGESNSTGDAGKPRVKKESRQLDGAPLMLLVIGIAQRP